MAKQYFIPREFFRFDEEWEFVGKKGGHYVFEHPETGNQILVTRKRSRELFGWVPGED